MTSSTLNLRYNELAWTGRAAKSDPLISGELTNSARYHKQGSFNTLLSY